MHKQKQQLKLLPIIKDPYTFVLEDRYGPSLQQVSPLPLEKHSLFLKELMLPFLPADILYGWPFRLAPFYRKKGSAWK